MNVLIVHDREEVGREIENLAQEVCSRAHIDLVDDASSARARLASLYYDILIIDLTIPVVSGRGSNDFHVAEGLLEELFASPALLTPGNIVGITKDDNALDNVQNNIGPHLMAVIAEKDGSPWRKQLSDRVRYVMHSGRSRSRSLLTKHNLDLLIVTALDKELSPFREFFQLEENRATPGLSDFVFTDRDGQPRRGACFAIGRAGQPSAASETQGLICQLRPRLAIMTGFCGGVPNKADLGDVLFAGSAFDWDYGKWKPSEQVARLYSRPEPVVIRNSRTHRVARQLVEQGIQDPEPLHAQVARLSKGEILEPKLRLVPFASGSAVIGDPNVLVSIKALNEDIGGVDMESFGFYFACSYPHAAPPEFLCIKSVADECGPEKDDRLHASSSYSSAYIARVIATELWEFDPENNT